MCKNLWIPAEANAKKPPKIKSSAVFFMLATDLASEQVDQD
nr:Conserved hypothetical protein [uncultured bacterium]